MCYRTGKGGEAFQAGEEPVLLNSDNKMLTGVPSKNPEALQVPKCLLNHKEIQISFAPCCVIVCEMCLSTKDVNIGSPCLPYKEGKIN